MRYGAAPAAGRQFSMVWVDRTGRVTPVDSGLRVQFTNFGENYGWALSPDGKRLALGLSTDAGDDIWVKQLPRGPCHGSPMTGRRSTDPVGCRTGANHVRLQPGRTGTGGLYSRPADGTGSDSIILRAEEGAFEGAWSPDGRWLLFRTGGTVGQMGGRDIVGIRPASTVRRCRWW